MATQRNPPRQNVIGIVYDFDGTLSPNNMQEDTIFKAYGIDKDEFWGKSKRLVEQGYERTLAYLGLLIFDETFLKKPLSRDYLKSLAPAIQYYPGVTDFFDRVATFMKTLPEVAECQIQLEHYIISSGLKEILEGISIYHHFKKVYASEYDYGKNGPFFPKLVINDTNKTQFLFRINKGKLNFDEDINRHMPDEERRIPFQNMVYIGDSETDIPSMTVVQKYGGHVIAVFDRNKGVSSAIREIVEQKRADHFAPADFREEELLVKILKRILKKIVYTIAYRGSAEKSLAWILQNRED